MTVSSPVLNALEGLKEKLGDRIVLDEEIRSGHRSDYGRWVDRMPGAVALCSDAKDVAEVVRYCREHGIEPATILKDIHSPLVALANLDYYEPHEPRALEMAGRSEVPLAERIQGLEKEMRAAARRLEFEEAAVLRDKLKELRELQVFAG